jgi:hypothetical protein
MGVMNWKRPTAINGAMNHAKTSFSTEIFAGATISVVQYLATLQYWQWDRPPSAYPGFLRGGTSTPRLFQGCL